MPDIVESPPTVVDGVVYVTSINHAYALDDATGSVIWSYDTERFPAREFPARVLHGVYYLSPDDRIHALDVQDGKEIWSYRASSFLSTAPVVSDGALFAATEAERSSPWTRKRALRCGQSRKMEWGCRGLR